MNEILAPLTLIPGVRLAALITPDGVPISLVQGRAAKVPQPSDRKLPEGTQDFAGYAGLAAGWLSQIARATDPLTWDRPRRAVLRGTRGTLIMSRAESAILMVILEQGTGAEDLRLPMECALAHMQRHLRGNGAARTAAANTNSSKPAQAEPKGAIPQSSGAAQASSPIENSLSDSPGNH